MVLIFLDSIDRGTHLGPALDCCLNQLDEVHGFYRGHGCGFGCRGYLAVRTLHEGDPLAAFDYCGEVAHPGNDVLGTQNE